MLNHNEQMKKLDEIEKKNIFEVPDGYFDQLAMKIQARTETISPSKTINGWRFVFRYALPVVLLAIGGIIVLKPKAVQDTEEMLAAIPTEHLVAYLTESEIGELELLEAINFDNKDVDSLSVDLHNQDLINGFETEEIKSVLENEL